MTPNEKTGNRKCWHVRAFDGQLIAGLPKMTRTEAAAYEARDWGRNACACLDGYHFVPCDGEAHSNAHIDHCSLCAPRWGVVMVPDVEAPIDRDTDDICDGADARPSLESLGGDYGPEADE